MFAKDDKYYPSRSGQTSLATAVTNFTKAVTKVISVYPGIALAVTKINFVPSTEVEKMACTWFGEICYC